MSEQVRSLVRDLYAAACCSTCVGRDDLPCERCLGPMHERVAAFMKVKADEPRGGLSSIIDDLRRAPHDCKLDCKSHAAIQAAIGYLEGLAQPPSDVLSHDALACLWDGNSVLQDVQKYQSGRQRTSPENVSDVLDAVVRLIRATQTKPASDRFPDATPAHTCVDGINRVGTPEGCSVCSGETAPYLGKRIEQAQQQLAETPAYVKGPDETSGARVSPGYCECGHARGVHKNLSDNCSLCECDRYLHPTERGRIS